MTQRDRLISKVNTTPIGLQDLLGNVNQGINPHELEKRIIANVDLYPHWSSRRIRTAFDFNTLPATGPGAVAVTVPEGELWQVISASFTTDGGAVSTNDAHLSIGIAPPGSTGFLGNFVRCGTEVINPLTTPGYQSCAVTFGQRFILSGGWKIIGIIEQSDTGGTKDCFTNVLYVGLSD